MIAPDPKTAARRSTATRDFAIKTTFPPLSYVGKGEDIGSSEVSA